MGKAVAAVATVVGAAAIVISTGGIGGAALFQFGAALALGGAARILAPKPQKPETASLSSFDGGGLLNQQKQRLQTIRSSVAARQIIYGETVVSGPLVAAFSSGTDNEFLHLFVCLAGHEVDSISNVWLNDTLSTDSKFTGLVTITSHTGTDSQAADAGAVSAITEWTTAHQLKGIAYLYVKLKWDRDVFTSGIPNIKAQVKGKKIYDPRDTLTDWTDNPILCQRDFLLNEFNAASGSVDDTVVAAQANVCDEAVSLRVSSNITVFADAGGGQVTVTSVNHGLSEGAAVTITGTTSYNGTFTATNITVDTFEITDTWVADDAAGLWTKAITAAADGGGGQVTITSAAHRLANGTTVTITGTTDYNGDFVISAVTANTFEITDTWVSSQTGTIEAATQARYVANGQLLRNENPINMIERIKTSCAGNNIRQQGKYKLYAGAYVTPTVTLTEDDLRGDIQISTKDSRKDLYNAVKGEYVSVVDNYLPTNFPPLTNSTFETDDGGIQIVKSIELPFTDNGIRAQRIAKIILMKSRQGTKVIFPAKMTAFTLAAWDTVNLTITKLGWSGKSFRILSWSLASDGGGIDLELQEEAAADWAWLSSDELAIPASVDMPIADPNTIGVIPTPTGLTATARRLEIVLTWTDDSGSNTTGYDIQRADNSGFSTNLVTLATDHSSNLFIDDLGAKATQRYYRIRGRGGAKRTLVSGYTSGVNATTAGIDTEEVVDNAITVSGSSLGPGDSTYGSTITTIATVTITTDGSTPVVVLISFQTYSSTLSRNSTYEMIHAGTGDTIAVAGAQHKFANSGDVRLDSGSTVIEENVSMIGLYTPSSSGSHTFNVRATLSGSGTGHSTNRNMVAMELKK
jgi:hypothetical protein